MAIGAHFIAHLEVSVDVVPKQSFLPPFLLPLPPFVSSS